MERRKMKKKGFTLVELLVVIAIIAMLLAILMPALGKVRQLAQRIMCSTNLAGLGKATLTYSNDDKYESFPIAGASGAYWDRGSTTASYAGKNCFDWRIPSSPENVTVHTTHYTTLSSCLYLLVKIADTTPDQFICPGSDNKKFDLNNYSMPVSGTTYNNLTFTDVWDFGRPDTGTKTGFTMGKGHNTYSYQLPIPMYQTQTGNVYPISTTSNPARPVMADRNPFWTFTGTYPPLTTGAPLMYTWDGSKVRQESLANGNAFYHQKDGQNVLYADLHAKFEKSANCGIQQDNIYTYWGSNAVDAGTEQYRQCGKGTQATSQSGDLGKAFENGASLQTISYATTNLPTNEEDSYLVSDLDNYKNN